MDKHQSLVLQQAAVNISVKTLGEDQIVAINGPPGTGKTTLLRDMIATVLVERAERMCGYDDPRKAFTDSGKKLKAGQGWLQIYNLAEELKNHGILIASSNNKAVENISTELPNSVAISGDTNAEYFSMTASNLFGFKCWGMIAAVLGNKANRTQFIQNFWWDKEVGLSTYLSYICGIEQYIDIIDENTGKIIGHREPKIISCYQPPKKNHQMALNNWQKARENFQQLLKKYHSKQKELSDIQDLFAKLDALNYAHDRSEAVQAALNQHLENKLNYLSMFFNTKFAHSWKKEYQSLLDQYALLIKVEKYRKELADHIIDDKLLNNYEKSQLTAPWYNSEMQSLRNDLFISAMELHKAFIDVAAKPLRHNLVIFMQVLANPYSLGQTHKINNKGHLVFLLVSCAMRIDHICIHSKYVSANAA